MRKLMFCSIGFTASCAVGAYLADGFWSALFFAAALMGLLLALLTGKTRVAVLCVGALVGTAWFGGYDALYLSCPKAYDTQTMDAVVVAADYSYTTDYGIAGDGEITLEGRTYRIRYYLYQDARLEPGDRISGKLRLRYTAAGGADEVTYHQGKGIFLLGYFGDDAQIHPAQRIPAKASIAIFRQDIRELLARIFPADTLAFVQALLLGDSSLLSYKDSADLSVSGIRHIIAVSGLHVSILYGMIYAILGYPRVLTPVLGFSLLALFAALAGFTPSVVRACIMQGLMLLAQVVHKEYDSPTALSFAVLVMLAVNPLTVTSVSFQLSVGCIIGILAFSGRISKWLLARLPSSMGQGVKPQLCRWFAAGVSVSVSAMVLTIPLSALYFGAVSIVSVLTNLLTLWAVTLVFCGVIGACIAGALWLPLGKGIGWCISWLARYVLLVSRTVAAFPLAAVYTQSMYICIWLVLCYVLIGAFFLTGCRRAKWVLGCILLSLCIAVGLSWLEPRLDGYRVTVLDVGQGQCVLLQAGGKNYMVDCGGHSDDQVADLAAQTLLSQGVFSLDGVIVTHYDMDHCGGLPGFLSRIPAQRLYLPDVADPGTIRRQLEERYSERICWIAPMEICTAEEGLVTVFAGRQRTSDNEKSLCVLFQPENCDILITADRSGVGERALLGQTQLPQLEVLVVGHHGAKDSACLELLAATGPEIAIISTDGDNNYGHPSQETLDRLERFGCEILRTDQFGNITIRGCVQWPKKKT